MLAVFLFAAAALRLYRISDKDVWLDEANAVLMAEKPLGELMGALQLDSNPPLYYLMLHYWMGAFGNSEFAIRSLSACCGALLVAGVFLVGWRLVSADVAAVAALLMTLAPMQVAHSQEARMYSLLPLAALGVMYFTWQCTLRSRRTDAVGLALCMLAALYVHNYGLLLIPAVATLIVTTKTLRSRLKLWIGVGVAVSLGYLPWLSSFAQQLENEGQYAWLVPLWNQWRFKVFQHTATTFALGWGEISQVAGTMPVILVAITPVYWAVAAYPVIRRSDDPSRERVVLFLLCFLLVPLATAFLISVLGAPCYVPGRCDQLVYPAFVLLAAVGLYRIDSKSLRYGLLTLIAAVLGTTLIFFYRGNAKAGDRDYCLAVLNREPPVQTVLCTSLTRAQLEYYARRASRPLKIISYPRDTAGHLGNQHDLKLLKDPGFLAEEADAVIDQIRRLSAPEGEFVLVGVRTEVNRILFQKISDRTDVRAAENLGDYQQSMLFLPITVRVLRLIND